jgi:hypothetical protein
MSLPHKLVLRFSAPSIEQRTALSMADGLFPNADLAAKSRAAGLAHARAGLAWHCPDNFDLLAYSLGHAAGAADFCCAPRRVRPPEEEPS